MNERLVKLKDAEGELFVATAHLWNQVRKVVDHTGEKELDDLDRAIEDVRWALDQLDDEAGTLHAHITSGTK